MRHTFKVGDSVAVCNYYYKTPKEFKVDLDYYFTIITETAPHIKIQEVPGLPKDLYFDPITLKEVENLNRKRSGPWASLYCLVPEQVAKDSIRLEQSKHLDYLKNKRQLVLDQINSLARKLEVKLDPQISSLEGLLYEFKV